MDWDCIVVGGGAAGLSAALVLGRARQRTLVVDAGQQSNLPAHGIGGMLGADGVPPADYYAAARTELSRYPVSFQDGELAGDDPLLRSGARVLLAPGMDYRLPDVQGVAERWGRSVFHCPFCHGWEVRERPLGVLSTDVHRPHLLAVWSDDVTLLTNGAEPDGPIEGVTVDRRAVAEIRDPDATVVFTDGDSLHLGGILIPVQLRQRSPVAAALGVEFAEADAMFADAIAVDGFNRTTVPGVWAAGDAAGVRPSVANAVASGAWAAATMVQDLTGLMPPR